MTTLRDDLEELSHSCFLIEDKLPHKWSSEEPTDASDIRRRLYCIRVELGSIIDNSLNRGVEYV